MFNHSAQSGDTEFAGNTIGFGLGTDKKLNKNTILGLGYAFNNTTAKSGDRDIDATGHTLFLYGEYKLSKPLYIDADLSYGVSNYKEIVPELVSSEYSTTTIGLNGVLGYDITDTIGVYVGSRYLRTSQDDYTDTIGQKISVQDDKVLTVRSGTKYTGKTGTIIPTMRLELTYDVMSNDRLAMVDIRNSAYQITGKNINPFGVQYGLGIMSNIDNLNLSLNYDIEWRADFVSHTGRIKAKYTF